MKRLAGLITVVMAALIVTGCDKNKMQTKTESPVVMYQGAVELSDKKFGLYYGDKMGDGTGVYYVVLSNAMCFNIGYANPYMDSEGDMLVLEFHGSLAGNESDPRLPDGVYTVGEDAYGKFTVNPAKSYVQKFEGKMQKKYSIQSGEFHVRNSVTGEYDIYTRNLVLVKGNETINVSYSYDGDIVIEDYRIVAPSKVGLKEDVIDIPYYEAAGGYYGNIYGYGTANYMITLSTKGFSEDDSNTLPGMMLVLNLFDKLPKGDHEVIAINPGTYKVQTYMDASVGSMLYGFSMSDTSGAASPFGTFFYQITANGEQSVEYIDSGYINLDRDDDDDGDGNYKYTIEYNFKSSAAGREYKGTWVGEIFIENLSTDSKRLVLSTLEDDVHCDMSKVETGRLSKIEILKSTEEKPRELKEVWQVVLEPRDWTKEEKEKYNWDERLDVWTPDGDVMILEFNLPLGSQGNLARNAETEYVYTVQPNCDLDSDDYTMCVSKMGRPYDDIFHPETAAKWGYDKYLWFPKEFDYCLSRRGFTWDGGYRGVWYQHMKTGSYYLMDEMAPLVHGTITVLRKGNVYTFTWDLKDDAVAQNSVTGSWTGVLKRVSNL